MLNFGGGPPSRPREHTHASVLRVKPPARHVGGGEPADPSSPAAALTCAEQDMDCHSERPTLPCETTGELSNWAFQKKLPWAHFHLIERLPNGESGSSHSSRSPAYSLKKDECFLPSCVIKLWLACTASDCHSSRSCLYLSPQTRTTQKPSRTLVFRLSALDS